MVEVSHAPAARFDEVRVLLSRFLATIGEADPGAEGYARIRSAAERGAIEFHVARDGEVAVGLISLTVGFSTYHAAPFALLEDLFVEESHRGCGVARRLIESATAEATARGCGSLLAGIGATDLRMWEHLGFRRIGLLVARDVPLPCG